MTMTTTATVAEVHQVNDDTTIVVERPDLVIVRMRGTIDRDMATASVQAVHRVTAGWPHVLMMVFFDQNDGMTAEGRKAAAELTAGIPFKGIAFVGGNFALRVVGKMLMQVINLTRKLDNPSLFCKTEAEARRWLADRRRALAAGEQAR